MSSEENTSVISSDVTTTPSITISSSFPDQQEKTPSSKCLKVIVIAKPSEKTRHLEDASEPGRWKGPTSTADTFYLPMVVFGYKIELKIPFE